MITIRGAITVQTNTREAILEATTQMLEEIIALNQLEEDELRAIFFSATKDLTAVYPAIAAREMGIVTPSLLCLQEMYVEGSLEKCIRILMEVEKTRLKQETVKHVYLRKAENLRPDLKK